jgi:hypothetical protein
MKLRRRRKGKCGIAERTFLQALRGSFKKKKHEE